MKRIAIIGGGAGGFFTASKFQTEILQVGASIAYRPVTSHTFSNQ